jgi:hypothetical protein
MLGSDKRARGFDEDADLRVAAPPQLPHFDAADSMGAVSATVQELLPQGEHAMLERLHAGIWLACNFET